MKQYIVKKTEENIRIDKFLVSLFKDIPRSFLSQNIKSFLTVDSKVVKASYRIKEKQVIEVNVKDLYEKYRLQFNKSEREGKICPQSGNLDIIFENENYLVLNKPSGIVVHPGIGHQDGTLANYVKQYLLAKGEYDTELKRAGIVHRLDMPVSGLIVFAKNRKFQRYLTGQFEKNEVLKIYFAEYETLGGKKAFKDFKDKKFLNNLIIQYKNGLDLNLEEWIEISGCMTRDRVNRKRMIFYGNFENKRFRFAKSYILPLSESKMYVLIKTGRMHQIRATLRSLDIVLRGDKLYGWKKESSGGIGLKSVVLGFKEFSNKRRIFNILNVLDA